MAIRYPKLADHDGADAQLDQCPCGSGDWAGRGEYRNGWRWYCGPCWAARHEARMDAAECEANDATD